MMDETTRHRVTEGIEDTSRILETNAAIGQPPTDRGSMHGIVGAGGIFCNDDVIAPLDALHCRQANAGMQMDAGEDHSLASRLIECALQLIGSECIEPPFMKHEFA